MEERNMGGSMGKEHYKSSKKNMQKGITVYESKNKYIYLKESFQI